MNRNALTWIALIGSLLSAGLMILDEVQGLVAVSKAAGHSPGGKSAYSVKPSTPKACTERAPSYGFRRCWRDGLNG